MMMMIMMVVVVVISGVVAVRHGHGGEPSLLVRQLQ
jgi:hypothetical protein